MEVIEAGNDVLPGFVIRPKEISLEFERGDELTSNFALKYNIENFGELNNKIRGEGVTLSNISADGEELKAHTINNLGGMRFNISIDRVNEKRRKFQNIHSYLNGVPLNTIKSFF